MGRYWTLKCPYCNTEVANGSGYGDTIPEIFAPFYRCPYCGDLMKTGGNEYLTLPVEKRTTIKRCRSLKKNIEESLDRTNNTDYLAFLESNGFSFFPITDIDKNRYKKVNFNAFSDTPPSSFATESLYGLGVLVDPNLIDQETGKIRKDVLENNQRIHRINQRISRWSWGAGGIVGILSALLFGSIDPESFLFFIGIVLGIAVGIVVNIGMTHHYVKKEKESESAATEEKQ